MKSYLLKSVTIINPLSAFHQQTADVLIIDGLIAGIDTHINDKKDIEVVDGKGQYLSPGFFDLNVNFGEPGFEVKEDIETGCEAASAGGFTELAIMPNTQPAIHSKAEVSFIVNQSRGNLVNVFPLGCISQQREGKELAEMFDMQRSGAIAFSDGNKAVADAGLMSRALLYAKGFDALIYSYPEDAKIAAKGKMNEGTMSTYLGMKGNPSIAEELMVVRDLYLAEYNDAKIHFTTISTSRSVDLIRKAKAKGIKVTCDVAIHHLLLSDDVLVGFDSNYKVKPPLRTLEDVSALLEGLKDGTIDAIVSQHTPHEIEFKDVEFEIAAYGIIGLQTVLPLALKVGLTPEQIVEKLAINPRNILGLNSPKFEVGEKANLILIDTEANWTYNQESNRSKSSNSPFLNQELKGKVTFICNNNQYKLN
ncbi:MAG: dihydroorotase [Sphingobacteriales bacterium]|nr:dihydroorotase [Sphingobacteriales bacterium]